MKHSLSCLIIALRIMRILSPKSLFTVKQMSLVADYDIETLFNLYGPIIGAVGSALYMSLLGEAHNQRITKVSTHESLLVKLQINTSEFLKARGYLEGLALLKTYVEKIGDETTYHYELYAPRTPNKFFANALLFGTLIKNVGEKEAMRLKMIYEINNETSTGDEISKTFGEVFNPDFNDEVYQRLSVKLTTKTAALQKSIQSLTLIASLKR